MPSYRVGTAAEVGQRVPGQERPVLCVGCGRVIGSVAVIGPLSGLDAGFVADVWPELAESVLQHEQVCGPLLQPTFRGAWACGSG